MRDQRRIREVFRLYHRSLKEVVTGLELCQRLYPALPLEPTGALIDEGNRIARMTRTLIDRLGRDGR